MYLLKVMDVMLNSLAAGPRGRIPVGGQAVIEGVLMRGPENWGLAVREPGGAIWRRSWRSSNWLKSPFWKQPVVRGCASMAEMMRVGMNALSTSAEISLGEEGEIGRPMLIFSIMLAIAVVIALFIVSPMLLSEFAASRLGFAGLLKNGVEGAARAAVFIAYVAVIGLWNDIGRVFAYHGAEHKTINAYESGADMQTEDVMGYSRIHRRCGTSFMFVVIFFSIVLFSLIGGGSLLWRAGLRVALLPLLVGVSYEFIRGASKSQTWGKICIMPALSLQLLTTREPDRTQVEVALVALAAALDPPDGEETAARGVDTEIDKLVS